MNATPNNTHQTATNHVLAVYDIPERLKVANPSALLRRYGIRINLSCWIFPANMVPTDVLDDLKGKGVTVHVVEFHERSQEKVLALARAELKTRFKDMTKYVLAHVDEIQERLDALDSELMVTDEQRHEARTEAYKSWRRIINQAKRELASAESCAQAFSIGLEIQDGVNSVSQLIRAQLDLSLALKDKLAQETVGAI